MPENAQAISNELKKLLCCQNAVAEYALRYQAKLLLGGAIVPANYEKLIVTLEKICDEIAVLTAQLPEPE
jgi:hypothetical protein